MKKLNLIILAWLLAFGCTSDPELETPSPQQEGESAPLEMASRARSYVEVAGLRWETTDETAPDGRGIWNIDGNTYFDFRAAQEYAAGLYGLRLPTTEELERLAGCPSRWDDVRNGRWIADRQEDLGNPEKSLFLEANGRINPSIGQTQVGTGGSFWSSSSRSTGNGFYLFFDRYGPPEQYGSNPSLGFSVRCVRSAPEFVTVAGLRWETTNETPQDGQGIWNIDGNTYFTFAAAQEYAAGLEGLRLPTTEDFGRLLECPRMWDEEKKGMWFADREIDLGDPDKSLFMEADGYRDISTRKVHRFGSYGYYWSSSPYTTDYGWYLRVGQDDAVQTYGWARSNGHSVRCVHSTPDEFVTVAGLRWRTTTGTAPDGEGVWNVDGSTYFTFDAAQEYAAGLHGLRLPTREDFDRLVECPRMWDEEKNGTWFADREEDLGDPDKSLFMKANGFLYSSGQKDPGRVGYYWSSSSSGSNGGWYLYVYKNNAYSNHSLGRYGYPVYCVQDTL